MLHFCAIPFGTMSMLEGGVKMNSWKEMAAKLTEEFMAWGCRMKRKQLPEIAMAYDCTPLFFWNWLDGETEKTEKGFLRVLGYAWRKVLAEGEEPAPGAPAGTAGARPETGKQIAA